jgi:MFS transporter, PAT family, beta-lactamase induction signal transducer AmpG
VSGIRVYRSRRVLVLGVLGFASGLPLLLTAETLGAWLTHAGVSLQTIGVASLVGLPYTVKWLWAPLFDRFSLPFLGRRRGWMLAFQLALIGAIAVLGSIDPLASPGALAVAAITVAFLSASHDVVLDAFANDSLRPDERAAGSALYVTGYRAAMMLTGVVALILADHVAWSTIYRLFAAAMVLGVIGTLLAEEPASTTAARAPSLRAAVREPILRFARQRRFLIVIGFVVMYRFGDFFAQVALVNYLNTAAGFSMTAIATAYKLTALGAIAVGGLVSGTVVAKFGLKRSLIAFGVVQAAANLGYLLVLHDQSTTLLVTISAIDNFANSLGAAAFVAYLMTRCEPRYSATQYAVLTAMSSVGGRVFGILIGPIHGAIGWAGLWAFSAAIAIPALLLITVLPMNDVRADVRAGPEPE